MGTSRETIKGWLEEGRRQGATHVIVACDTFGHANYPIYVAPRENVQLAHARATEASMQRVMEVYALHLDLDKQLDEPRAFHLEDAGVLDGARARLEFRVVALLCAMGESAIKGAYRELHKAVALERHLAQVEDYRATEACLGFIWDAMEWTKRRCTRNMMNALALATRIATEPFAGDDLLVRIEHALVDFRTSPPPRAAPARRKKSGRVAKLVAAKTKGELAKMVVSVEKKLSRGRS